MHQREEQSRPIQLPRKKTVIQSNIRRKRVVLLVIVAIRSFCSVIASGVNWVIVGLIGVCGFILVFIKVVILIFNGSEVRVMGARSRFSDASVFAFPSPAKPTSVWIVNTFASVFAFALRSSLSFSEVKTWMLDDESFGNSVKVAFVTD